MCSRTVHNANNCPVDDHYDCNNNGCSDNSPDNDHTFSYNNTRSKRLYDGQYALQFVSSTDTT
jgi:hypothetical protein